MGCRDRRLGKGVSCAAPCNPGGWRPATARTHTHFLVSWSTSALEVALGVRRTDVQSRTHSYAPKYLEALVTRGRRWGWVGKLCFTSEKFNFLCVKNTERPPRPCQHSSIRGQSGQAGPTSWLPDNTELESSLCDFHTATWQVLTSVCYRLSLWHHVLWGLLIRTLSRKALTCKRPFCRGQNHTMGRGQVLQLVALKTRVKMEMTAFRNQSHQQQSLTGLRCGRGLELCCCGGGGRRESRNCHVSQLLGSLCWAHAPDEGALSRRRPAGKVRGRVHPALSLPLSVGFMSSDQLFWPAAVQTLKARLVFQPKTKKKSINI